jgi:hypothetical protein
VRELLVQQGISINALSFNNKRASNRPYRFATPPDVHAYYRDKIIGGPGAFVVAVTGLDDFADAIRRKLILEIASPRPSNDPLGTQAEVLQTPQ